MWQWAFCAQRYIHSEPPTLVKSISLETIWLRTLGHDTASNIHNGARCCECGRSAFSSKRQQLARAFCGCSAQVHCVDPFSGETLDVATGLPILLTSLAVVPRLALPSQSRRCRSRQEGGGGGSAAQSSSGGDAGLSSSSGAAAASESHGAWTDAAASAAASAAGDDDGGDEEEIVVAVGGVGGRVSLLALQVSLPLEAGPAE